MSSNPATILRQYYLLAPVSSQTYYVFSLFHFIKKNALQLRQRLSIHIINGNNPSHVLNLGSAILPFSHPVFKKYKTRIFLCLNIKIWLPNRNDNRMTKVAIFCKVLFCSLIHLSMSLKGSFQNSTAPESDVRNCFGHFLSTISQE